jgi:hypothetical protein
VVSRTYEVGGNRFGIRTDSMAFCGWLDRTFRRYRVAGEANPRYSILIAGAKGDTGGKQFNILYKQTSALVRTMDLTTLARALVVEMESLSYRERDDAIFTELGMLTTNGTRALLPGRFTAFLGRLGHRQTERAGVSLPGTMYVAVDPKSGRAVPAPPHLKIPEDSFERLAEIGPTNGSSDRVFVDEPSPVDVVFWVDNLSEVPFHPVGRGFVLSRLWTWTVNAPVIGKTAIEGLTRLVEPTRCYGLQITEARETLQNIVTAIKSG